MMYYQPLQYLHLSSTVWPLACFMICTPSHLRAVAGVTIHWYLSAADVYMLLTCRARDACVAAVGV